MLSRFLRPLLVLAVGAVAFAPAAHAHDAPAPAADGASIKAEFNVMLSDAETKVLDLAQATPADKYGWAPGKGVRTMSEVFMHMAGANYFIPTFVGQPVPEGVNPQAFEGTVKEKDAVIKTLKESFASAHAAIDKTKDLDTKIKLFGHDMTKRQALLILVTHSHEHLGQAIAYARSNDITPPWTAKAEAAAAEKAKAAGAK